ncbi:MAG: DUF4340 domain-containing protein [Oscillospiraceae bacterium]|nr:DUF4340 domain-containing protein [Oscillospiraceae bacterium]
MKKIIIAAIAVLILGGATMFLMLSDNNAIPPDEPNGPTTAGRPIDINFDDVTAIDFTPRMGMAYTITITRDADGEETAALTPGRDGFDYQQVLLMRSATAAVALEHISLLRRNVSPDELTYFGFDEPLMQWTIHANGDQYSFEMGADAGGGDSVYVRAADGTNVYLLPFMSGILFARAEHELRLLRFLPDYASRVDALLSLNYFDIQGSRTPFSLRRMTDDEAEVAPLMAMYQFITPTTMFIESHYLNELLFDPFLGIGFSAVVEDDPEDLAIYGLDDPYVVHVRDIHGWEATLLVGNEHEHGGRYVKLEGFPTVFHDRAGDYSFLDINYTILINRLFWLHEITDIARVEWQFSGDLYIVEYDVTDDDFHATFNGGDISSNNARRLYQNTLLLHIHSRIDDDAMRGEHYGSITLFFRDGNTEELSFYVHTERILNARLNGLDLGLTVSRSGRHGLDDLLNRFDIVQAGDELPN